MTPRIARGAAAVGLTLALGACSTVGTMLSPMPRDYPIDQDRFATTPFSTPECVEAARRASYWCGPIDNSLQSPRNVNQTAAFPGTVIQDSGIYECNRARGEFYRLCR